VRISEQQRKYLRTIYKKIETFKNPEEWTYTYELGKKLPLDVLRDTIWNVLSYGEYDEDTEVRNILDNLQDLYINKDIYSIVQESYDSWNGIFDYDNNASGDSFEDLFK